MFCAGFDKGGTDACQVSVLVCLSVWDSNYGPPVSDMSLCLSTLFQVMLVFSAYNLSVPSAYSWLFDVFLHSC